MFITGNSDEMKSGPDVWRLHSGEKLRPTITGRQVTQALHHRVLHVLEGKAIQSDYNSPQVEVSVKRSMPRCGTASNANFGGESRFPQPLGPSLSPWTTVVGGATSVVRWGNIGGRSPSSLSLRQFCSFTKFHQLEKGGWKLLTDRSRNPEHVRWSSEVAPCVGESIDQRGWG